MLRNFLIPLKGAKMYLDQIKAELVEAQDVLNKFISDENNIKLIQQAALLRRQSVVLR